MKIEDLLEQFDLKHNLIINEILDNLRKCSFSSKIKIFGSIQAGKSNPSDVDFFIDLSDYKINDYYKFLNKINWFLRLAKKYYGYVDPFILIKIGNKTKLITRNDEATNWQSAYNAIDILSKAQNGKSLQSVENLKTE